MLTGWQRRRKKLDLILLIPQRRALEHQRDHLREQIRAEMAVRRRNFDQKIAVTPIIQKFNHVARDLATITARERALKRELGED